MARILVRVRAAGVQLALGGLGAGDLRLLDEFLEKRAEVDHCFAQIFGVCLSLGLTERALVRGAVIFEDERMVHGDVVGALFEIADRIAASGHHVGEQLVGIDDGASGSRRAD